MLPGGRILVIAIIIGAIAVLALIAAVYVRRTSEY